MPLLSCENAPVAVPLAATQAALPTSGTGNVVDQHVPRAVTVVDELPVDTMLAPKVAEVAVIAVAVGVFTTGATAVVVKVPSPE